MASPLDEVFELLPEVEGYIDQDRAKKWIRVRADDGRVVTLYFRPAEVAAGLKGIGDVGWLGDRAWSPARRWVALTSIHINESINAMNKATEYVQRAGGFDPVDPPPIDYGFDPATFDPTGASFRMGGGRVFDATGAHEADAEEESS